MNIAHDDGRACDRTHPCTWERYCIEGACRADGFGLVGHWKFDEVGSNQVLDSSGNNLVGELSGGVNRTVDAERGNVVSFDGKSGRITIPNRGGLFNVRNQFTIAAWFKPGTQIKYTCLVCRGLENDDGDYYNLAVTNTSIGVLTRLRPDLSLKSIAFDGALKNEWTHAVATYDGGALRLFLNGEEAVSAALSGPLEYGITDGGVGAPLAIGHGLNSQGASEFYNGLIDDVRFDDRAHSADEIRELYQRSKAR